MGAGEPTGDNKTKPFSSPPSAGSHVAGSISTPDVIQIDVYQRQHRTVNHQFDISLSWPRPTVIGRNAFADCYRLAD